MAIVKKLSATLSACILLAVSACGGSPTRGTKPAAPTAVAQTLTEQGAAIAQHALDQLGRPYRFGGSEPSGFDCSGLVRFAYNQIGISVPRTTVEQYQTAHPVGLTELMPGDVLFFKLTTAEVSHVAINLGDGRFVHAPASGRNVEVRKLEGYFQTRLIGAGRFP
jgi:murein DD-endopeptidase